MIFNLVYQGSLRKCFESLNSIISWGKSLIYLFICIFKIFYSLYFRYVALSNHEYSNTVSPLVYFTRHPPPSSEIYRNVSSVLFYPTSAHQSHPPYLPSPSLLLPNQSDQRNQHVVDKAATVYSRGLL